MVLENRGEVEATYSLVKPDTLFGPKFNFAPSEGILQPGGLQAIEVRDYWSLLVVLVVYYTGYYVQITMYYMCYPSACKGTSSVLILACILHHIL